MPLRTMVFLLIAFTAIGSALILNVISAFWQGEKGAFISKAEVRGMAIMHKEKLFTLNFDQQNQVIDILNRTIPVKLDSEISEKNKPGFDSIVIYHFHGDDIEIKPIGFVDSSLVFSVPAWNAHAFLKEVSQGELQKLLGQTYDP